MRQQWAALDSFRKFLLAGLAVLVAGAMLALSAVSFSAIQASFGLDTRPANPTCVAPERPPQNAPIALQTAATLDHSMLMATAFVQAPNDPSRWYVVDREGVIRRYQRSGKTFTVAGTFADLKDRVTRLFKGVVSQEMGLLGLAFHPRFAENGYVFIYYSAVGTAGTPVEARLSRFISRDGGQTLDAASEEILIRTPRISQWHWGGTLGFGPDGYLYTGFGDGSEPTKPQSLAFLNGKMIRINVDAAPGYAIPPDNPFVSTAGARPEIYAYGFRNPWRWAFDRQTGILWLGDVGALEWEEVNIVQKGGNYGWPIREGAHCLSGTTCSSAGMIDPVVEYGHTGSFPSWAVIGGAVYAGATIPNLRGIYIFGDVSSGRIFALRYDAQGKAAAELLLDSTAFITSFAQDEFGEIYVVALGRILLIAPAGPTAPSTFPERLSQTGCVDPANPAVAAAGVIPYDIISPLWSDGAAKRRWMAIPDGKTIHVNPDGDWDLPIGSVLIKEFQVQGRKVETRLLVRHSDGEWAGYSYEWNDAQTDATLLPGGKTKVVGNQTWLFPSRSQCLDCHTVAAGRTLGLETGQLNRLMTYPTTNRLSNQILTLNHINMFDVPMVGPATAFPKLPDPANPATAINERARSYLHANCSICHRPGGTGQGPEDFRYSTPANLMGAIYEPPTQRDFGIPGALLIAPGDPQRSIVNYRIRTLELGRMPPLASSVVDPHGASLIAYWIRTGLGMGSPDTDSDGFADNADNCRTTPNPGQQDTDGDGYGNICDADFNNDGVVNSLDLGILNKAFGSTKGAAHYNPHTDMNSDGQVNALDLGLLRLRFGKPAGE